MTDRMRCSISCLFSFASGLSASTVHCGTSTVKFTVSVFPLFVLLLFLVVLVLFCSRNDSGMYGSSMCLLPVSLTLHLLFLGTCEYCIPGKQAV